MIIKNAMVYCEDGVFRKQNIAVDGERIVDSSPENSASVDGEGLYAIPGLTDIHFHGCMGHDFCDGTEEAITAMAEYEGKNGITTICPATMTLGDDTLSGIFKAAAAYEYKKGAMLVGINMEGPYLSQAKKGAQNGTYLRKPDVSHFRNMNQLAGGLIKLVSIAPEEEGSMEFIRELKDEVILSVAHTTADYDIASEAFSNGASHVTHLYNAMPPFTHRTPSVVGAAFDAAGSHVELICDGVHIHPSVVRATLRLFGDDRMVLISDSMMATGMEDGEYSLGGQAVTVKGNRATLIDGTIAGSATNLMRCMETAVSFGIPLETAVKCAAVNPAKVIGIYDQVGSLTPGKYANIVLLDSSLNVQKVWIKGQEQ